MLPHSWKSSHCELIQGTNFRHRFIVRGKHEARFGALILHEAFFIEFISPCCGADVYWSDGREQFASCNLCPNRFALHQNAFRVNLLKCSLDDISALLLPTSANVLESMLTAGIVADEVPLIYHNFMQRISEAITP